MWEKLTREDQKKFKVTLFVHLPIIFFIIFLLSIVIVGLLEIKLSLGASIFGVALLIVASVMGVIRYYIELAKKNNRLE